MAGRGADEKESKPIHGIDLGTWLQKKLENLSAAQMSLTMLTEKHETSPPIFVFRMKYFCPSWKRPSPCFQYVYPRRRWLCLLGSRVKVYTLRGRQRRFVDDSALHACFGRAPLLVDETAEKWHYHLLQAQGLILYNCSHLNVLTFFPPDWGMLRRSRRVLIYFYIPYTGTLVVYSMLRTTVLLYTT